eukprot:GHVR01023752.1.p1 GENE.GHVR01023752.1~~GHVR01023752.1.p1  ORF type:complete len:244 (+),score=66.72 GHVR01023752.1:64-795(+)
MGASLAKYDDLPRKAGQHWNNRQHNPQFEVETFEEWQPSFLNSQKFLVCRCYKSDKFPLCDQSHGALNMQGANIGPCLLEVRRELGYAYDKWFSKETATPSKKMSDPVYLGPSDPVESFEKVDPNVYKYNDYHHHIASYPDEGNIKVRICRCWQSKRFPVCDDTHKALIEAGDPVGPYTAVLRGRQGGGMNYNNIFRKVQSGSKTVAVGVAVMVGVSGILVGAGNIMNNIKNNNNNNNNIDID